MPKIIERFSARGNSGASPLKEVKELREVPGINWRSGDLGVSITRGGEGIGPQVFQIYTKEFLDAMAASLEKQVTDFEAKYRRGPVIFEIAAGDGRLTEALNRRLASKGIRIRATDLHQPKWNISLGTRVEKMDAVTAATRGPLKARPFPDSRPRNNCNRRYYADRLAP